MSCPINLFTALQGGPETNGTWVFTSTTNPSSNLEASVNSESPAGIYNPGNSIGAAGPTPHAPVVDFSASANAEYVFTYTTGSGGACQDSAVVTVTVEDGVYAGVDFAVTLCANENVEYNLWNYINTSGTPTLPAAGLTAGWGGDVSNAGYTAGLANDPQDDTFNPFNRMLGTVSFTYSVSRIGTEENCANCADEATVTITVADAPNAGVGESITVCSALV